jgi:Phosphatidylglycerophosphate synthase
MGAYHVGDRRPLASRGWGISQRIAEWLAKRGVNPNSISLAGMFCGIAAGLLLAATSRASHSWLCWLGAAVLVQLRLLANLYDGMVAVLRQIASPVGELFNEVPDRVSDAATLIGFGYAAGSNPLLGFVATCFALFLPYLRVMGKVVGAHQEFCGPMAKQQRMAVVTFAAILCAIVPVSIVWKIPTFGMWIIIAGSVITCFRRLRRILTTLQSQ